MKNLFGRACLFVLPLIVAGACGGSQKNGGGFAGDDGGAGGDGASSSSSGGSLSGDSGGPDGTTSSSGSGGGGSSSSGDATGPCYPNGITCQGNVAVDCKSGKTTTTTCKKPQVCADGYGCVACVPGSGSCNGNVGTECKPDGSGTITNNCDPLLGESCNPPTGTCLGVCANLGASYIGCEYYAVPMGNSAIMQNVFYFSVSLSNTSNQTANVSIVGPGSTNVTDTIAAGQLKEYKLPWVDGVSCGGPSSSCTSGAGPSPTTTLAAASAYHIRSTQPLTAYEFNARDYVISGTYSYTNDASLLIPVNALTGNYRVLADGTWYFTYGHQYPGLVAVIGTQNGTQVTYTAPAGNPIQGGAGLSTTGGTVTLNQGDVLQIAAAGNGTASAFGSDQSGALLTATQPVEVLGGVDCTYMSATVPACDHNEEIVFPLETLSKDYLVTLPNNVNGTPQQYVKIIGTQNGTTLTYDPPQAGAATTLNAGQVTQFHTTQHFHVTATQPVLVGQDMESENNFSTSNTAGDPSLSTAVGTSQFRNSYQFVAPANYMQNWVNVIAPTGATVTIDGTNVTGFTAIGSSGYSAAYVSLCANNSCSGIHTASSADAFGIQVYGYGSYTSYMYPGGLNLLR